MAYLLHLRDVNGVQIPFTKRMKTLTKILAVFAITLGSIGAASAQTSLPSLAGGSVDVQAQRGKVVILAVGASWLPQGPPGIAGRSSPWRVRQQGGLAS